MEKVISHHFFSTDTRLFFIFHNIVKRNKNKKLIIERSYIFIDWNGKRKNWIVSIETIICSYCCPCSSPMAPVVFSVFTTRIDNVWLIMNRGNHSENTGEWKRLKTFKSAQYKKKQNNSFIDFDKALWGIIDLIVVCCFLFWFSFNLFHKFFFDHIHYVTIQCVVLMAAKVYASCVCLCSIYCVVFRIKYVRNHSRDSIVFSTNVRLIYIQMWFGSNQ